MENPIKVNVRRVGGNGSTNEEYDVNIRITPEFLNEPQHILSDVEKVKCITKQVKKAFTKELNKRMNVKPTFKQFVKKAVSNMQKELHELGFDNTPIIEKQPVDYVDGFDYGRGNIQSAIIIYGSSLRFWIRDKQEGNESSFDIYMNSHTVTKSNHDCEINNILKLIFDAAMKSK